MTGTKRKATPGGVAGTQRRRGRPPNKASPARRQIDATIGKTIWTLACWGFPLRRRVYPLVGVLARTVLGLKDSAGRALGPDRIEQIFEDWHSVSEYRHGRPWMRYTLRSLEVRQPVCGFTLEQVAEALLRDGGEWLHVDPGDDQYFRFDPEMTPKAHANYLRSPRLRIVKGKTG